MKKKILIVEDEAVIREILTEPLRSEGYEVVTAADGVEGMCAFHSQEFHLVILDIMLPKVDGYAVCEMIRRESEIPILILTALDTEDDQMKGFDLLADDYVTKPFSIKLVLKRVEALLRRTEPKERTSELRCKTLKMKEEQRQVFVDNREVMLTNLEFEILRILLKNQRRVFTRDDLLNLVWGYEFAGDERDVNFHIMNLRKKLGAGYIETVRGVGYKIVGED